MVRKTLSLSESLRLEIVAFVVGLVILAFELTASRIVAPYLGSTIYTWTSVIGVILAALAVGYAWGGVLSDTRKKTDDVILLLIGSAATIIIVNIVKERVLNAISQVDMPLQLQAFLGSVFLFAAPTVLMGTIMPYLARLSITELATSGRRLSRIDAASTIGSLVGTFLTGYVLFGFIGTRYLLVLAALSLLLVSFVLQSYKYVRLRVILVGTLLMFGLSAPAPLLSGFVSEIDTPYNRVIVRDVGHEGRVLRMLQTDSQGVQSGVYRDGSTGHLALAYTRSFAYAAELKPEAREYLVIGGGAFTVPQYLALKRPDATIDAVEIDSGLAAISEHYFGFTRPANIRIIHADGRQFLNTTNKRYDVIFLDAFNSIVPPFQLLTTQAAARVAKAVESDGIVAANLISAPAGSSEALIKAVYSTFRSQFAHVSIYRVTPDVDPQQSQNSLLLASHQPIAQSSIDAVAARYAEFDMMTRAKVDIAYDASLVMRDDFAPVERLSLQ